MTGIARRAVAVCLVSLLGTAALGQDHYALLIGGLGGSPEQSERLRQLLFGAHQALIAPLGVDEAHITVLAETALAGESFVDDIATDQSIQDWFDHMAGIATLEDQVLVLLIGHGTFDGRSARFNIPRRDLTAEQYADLLNLVPAGRGIFVNTASASAPFIQALSAPGRIIIAATRTATQTNQTVFPEFFVKALTTSAADLDKDGGLSIREAFHYASEQTAASFVASGLLAAEHSILEDTGDGIGYQATELAQNGEGFLAATTYLSRRPVEAPEPSDPALVGNRNQLEEEIAALIARKSTLPIVQYYAELEQLFVSLARLNDQIEESGQ